MLRLEERNNYLIYPFWARFSYVWEDLPRLFAEPFRSGYFESSRGAQSYWDRGYPQTPQPHELIGGPCGGGIVRWESDSARENRFKWLPLFILRSEADMLPPNGMTTIHNKFDAHVNYLEPNLMANWAVNDGRPMKVYRCGTSTEHIESGGDEVYWLICAKSGRREIQGLDDVPAWASHFGLKAARRDEMPQPILEETTDWFEDPQTSLSWFEVKDGGEELNRQFSIMMYIAYHLRRVGGARMVSMHLVSRIEGKPHLRRFWSSK